MGGVDITASHIIAISDAVQAHVSSCFLLEAEVADAISGDTITTFEQIEAEFE